MSDIQPKAVEKDGIIADLKSRIADKDAEIERLRDAFERIMDVQNGPPLIRERVEWNEAMAQACEALGRDATFYREAAKAAGGDDERLQVIE